MGFNEVISDQQSCNHGEKIFYNADNHKYFFDIHIRGRNGFS